MKILVVDDEKIILQGIAKLLKANSLVSEVYCAEDAFIALDFLKCHRVDVVVTDIRMPEMDGLEFIKEAKKQNFCNDFIILSGYAEFKYDCVKYVNSLNNAKDTVNKENNKIEKIY